ncbi:MAG: type 1 glutamine amidotransferase, partial [Rhodothermales bacterium]
MPLPRFLLCLLALPLFAAVPERWKDLTPEQTAAIDNAASQVVLSVKPAKKAKLLMVTYAQGFWHGSIPYGAKALELIGQKTGAFSITRAEDQSAFTAANLAKFDAIIVNNVTGIDKFITDEANRAAFIEFVNKGGGLFANHSASDGGWPEYSNLIGGRFAGHPWGGGGTWGFQVEDPKSLLARAFNQPQFTLADEIYMLRDHFSRDTHRVLVSLDLSHPGTDAAQSKGSRPDRDYPVTLIRGFGEGRVFYSVFGHREDIHSNPVLLQHYTDGLQYVLGDLKVNDSPPDIWERLARYQSGRSTEVEQKILGMINDETKDEVEAKFLALLASDASTDAKIFVLDYLPRVWSAKSIPALSALVSDAAINQRVIEELRGAVANFAKSRSALHKTLQAGLANASAEAQIPLLNALGHERAATAIPAIAKRTNSADQGVADSAILALGDIGSADGLPALRSLEPSTKIHDAILRIAENLDGDAATAVYRELLTAKPAAAFHGLVRAQGSNAIPTLAKALTGPNRRAAISALARAPGADDTLAAISPQNSSDSLALITAWRNRGGKKARTALRGLSMNTDELVASEAYRALGAVGEAGDLPTLIGALERGGGAADVALDVLANFPKPGTDAALIAAINQSAEISEILGARRAKSAAPALMRARLSDDSGISREAWKALANCATPAELPGLIASFATVDSRAAGRLEDVILALKDSVDEAAIIAAIPTASEAGRATALSLLGHFQSPATLAALRAHLAESAALKAIALWESPEPLDDLHALALGATDKSTLVLSLRAFAAILGTQNGVLDPERLLREYTRGFSQSKHPETTVDLLSAIAEFANKNAAELAAGFIGDESAKIADAAWRAVTQMNGRLGSGNWKFAASHEGEPLQRLMDRDPNTRWSTGRPKIPGMWVSIDFGVSMPIRKVVLDNTNPERRSQNDIPQSARLQVSDDGTNWQALASTFKSGPLSTFTADGNARHLKINFEGDAAGSYWSIHELYINAKPNSGPEMALVNDGVAATASEQPRQAG